MRKLCSWLCLGASVAVACLIACGGDDFTASEPALSDAAGDMSIGGSSSGGAGQGGEPDSSAAGASAGGGDAGLADVGGNSSGGSAGEGGDAAAIDGGTWCDDKAFDLCEDFDRPALAAGWGEESKTVGSQVSIGTAHSVSEPNALASLVGAIPGGDGGLEESHAFLPYAVESTAASVVITMRFFVEQPASGVTVIARVRWGDVFTSLTYYVSEEGDSQGSTMIGIMVDGPGLHKTLDIAKEPQNNVWHEGRLTVVGAPANGSVIAAIDGESPSPLSIQTSSGGEASIEVQIGLTHFSIPPANNRAWYDNVTIDSQ